MNIIRKRVFILITIVMLASGLKAWLLFKGAFPFNSDEAIVGLMARHILLGERPLFFYGQSYMGSLDAFLVSFVFRIIGSQVWGIRLVQILLYSITIVTTYKLAQTIFGSTQIGVVAALLMAVPTINVTLYTTVSLGGYGEALLLGNILLWVGFKILQLIDEYNGKLNYKIKLVFLLWGGVLGLGLWANGLTLVFGFPMGVAIAWKLMASRGRAGYTLLGTAVLFGVLGLIVGSIPWWIHAVQHGLQRLVLELLGSAVSVESGGWISKVFQHAVNMVLLGWTAALGLRPPWAVRWLGLPLLPFVLIFWFFVFRFWAREMKKGAELRQTHWILMGVPLTVTAGFLFTSFGVDPSGRYFVPLLVPMSLVAGEMIVRQFNRWYWRGSLIALIMLFHLIGTVQCAINIPPGISTQFDQTTVIDHHYMPDLIKFLHQEGETRGYTNYWVAYPLAFQSDEKLIYIPRLPYHYDMRYTTRDDRYPEYTEMVNSSEKTAYITSGQPGLENFLRSQFVKNGVQWKEKTIGDYRVFYSLSKNVRVEEIGLGVNYP